VARYRSCTHHIGELRLDDSLGRVVGKTPNTHVCWSRSARRQRRPFARWPVRSAA